MADAFTTKSTGKLDLRPGLEPLRQFSKRTFNPLTLRLAGKRFFPFGVLHHVGRKSGKQYKTPVGAAPVADGFVIALTYGSDTDWSRNLRAAGSATLVYQGSAYRVSEPVIVGEDGRGAFPLYQRVFLNLMRVDKYMEVKAEPAA
ncbi:MAG TPA: nitroreductase family deazaflavin-dependent oxidoreductase [Chloroflexia bacterium]|nr:nitroreductase family deazaflavin-dependent oxidoreductase [Chloroflexia bacterium]